MDKFDSETRSRVMSRIKSTGTKTTERRVRAALVAAGKRGWLVGNKMKLPGSPDFVFPKTKTALFVDGCFWHGCPRCYTSPKTRRVFWAKKVERNKRRDRLVFRILKNMNWRVVRI